MARRLSAFGLDSYCIGLARSGARSGGRGLRPSLAVLDLYGMSTGCF